MFLQEVLQQAHPFDVQRVLETVVPSVIVGVLTYLLTRNKNQSEATKNRADAGKSIADTEKSHTETVKLYLEIIATLNDEISDWIKQVKGLRVEVDTVEKENDELKRQQKHAVQLEEEKLTELNKVFKTQKDLLVDAVDNTIKAMTGLLDALIGQGISQQERMKAVQILEALHNLKDQLKK